MSQISPSCWLKSIFSPVRQFSQFTSNHHISENCHYKMRGSPEPIWKDLQKFNFLIQWNAKFSEFKCTLCTSKCLIERKFTLNPRVPCIVISAARWGNIRSAYDGTREDPITMDEATRGVSLASSGIIASRCSVRSTPLPPPMEPLP